MIVIFPESPQIFSGVEARRAGFYLGLFVLGDFRPSRGSGEIRQYVNFKKIVFRIG